ncbi:methylated-DNA--[protein]-cysteine S-methyltransferase [Arthrobacter tumbae]|uniref:methylated-DNA--[protein]-cysteine S-methyltransferase n=1 Tax=Arthrobacter tumbae TaxID=163874 RepID=UPI00195C634B|nr:methylated-DNA--[protein]-cysteine S-methyltransferase [Arthrobacter tumbae]MBM7783296.1 methylated-DNA-[protein]-cysteine S-methyltransferase [Arthrobacter tumbae]
MNTFTIIDSPIGGLVLVARNEKLVGVYHEYHSPEPSPVLLGLPIEADSQQIPSVEDAQGEPPAFDEEAAAEVFRRTGDWLRGYFSGAVADPVPYDPPAGTDFQRTVWEAVADIPYGETRTYKDIAEGLGNVLMGRAVGAAVRANPLSLIIPGHRVVGAGGAITGYAAGVAVKRALLELEAAVTAGAAA